MKERNSAEVAWRIIIVLAVVMVLQGAVVFFLWRTIDSIQEDIPKNRGATCSVMLHAGTAVEDLPAVCLEVEVRPYLDGPSE